MPHPTGNSIRREASKAFKFDGMRELQTALADIVDATNGKQMKDVFFDAGSVLGNQIRANAPRRRGILAHSIYVARGPETYPNVLVGVRYRIAPHAHLVEWGHGGPHPAPPHPFVRPAVTQTSGRIQQIIRTGLEDIIAKNAKG